MAGVLPVSLSSNVVQCIVLSTFACTMHINQACIGGGNIWYQQEWQALARPYLPPVSPSAQPCIHHLPSPYCPPLFPCSAASCGRPLFHLCAARPYDAHRLAPEHSSCTRALFCRCIAIAWAALHHTSRLPQIHTPLSPGSDKASHPVTCVHTQKEFGFTSMTNHIVSLPTRDTFSIPKWQK